MSPSPPVPSKAALRTLRNLALGTSCTIAFGAGLITEDRRRRIHTTREISENARRLKASRKYHNTGLSVAATFEEQVENYCKYGPWKGGDKQRILDPDWSDVRSNAPPIIQKSQVKPAVSIKFSGPALTEPRQLERIDSTEMTNYSLWKPIGHPKASVLTDSIPGRPIASPKFSEERSANFTTGRSKMQEKVESQKELAMEMSYILESGTGAQVITHAVATFRKAFQEGLLIEAASQHLLDACILLAQACDRHDQLDVFIPVLRKILSYGNPIDEESFYKLYANKAIARLLERSGYRHADHQIVTSASELKHAVAIFITETIERPKPLSKEMRDVGLQLCTATLRANLYELTEAVYWRLLSARADVTAPEVECLILAEHARAFWDQVLHHFSKYFSRTLPNQNQLYAVVSAAIDSAFELERIDKAEEVLLTAIQMAKNSNLRTSTTWHLRVLGEHWRKTRNIASTRALFDRLETSIEHTSHPQAIYSAIIQFCVEAGSESQARQYLERLKQVGDGETVDLRTYGHLALAKAMRNDWDGVKADFCFMKSLAKDSIREHSDVFVPILKLFVTSHGVGQVEDFVRLYLEELGVVPNQYVFNIIVDTYCKAEELSNIPRWIEYVRHFGLQIDAVTFNTILSRYQKQWAAHPDDLFRLYKETKEKIGPIFDSTTIQILRRAAVTSATPYHAARLLRRVKSVTRISKSSQIEAEMRTELAQGKHTKVLKSYKFALRTGKSISREGFSIAVRASIRSATDGNLNSTVKLIIDARSRGFDILPSMAYLLLHQVNVSSCDNSDIVSLVKHVLAVFEKHGLEVTLAIASKVISVLIDRGRPEEALMLWNTLASYDHIGRQLVDLVLLTVLLRAYIMISDVAGIKWVMTMLVENNIIPDTHFKQVVKNARNEARRFRDAQPDSIDAKERHEVLIECMRLVIAQRLNGETKRKEAEQLTLSILENALAMKPVGESPESLPEVLHVKRSQRIRNPNQIRQRLGKYSKQEHLGETSTAKSRRADRKRYSERACVMIREKDMETTEKREAKEGGHLREEQIIDEARIVPSSLETKQALAGWKGFDTKYFDGRHELQPQVVRVAAS